MKFLVVAFVAIVGLAASNVSIPMGAPMVDFINGNSSHLFTVNSFKV
jgi:hypothetical protein